MAKLSNIKRMIGAMAALIAGVCTAVNAQPLALKWHVDAYQTPTLHRLTLVNGSEEEIPAGWALNFGSLMPGIKSAEGAPVVLEQISGSHYRLVSVGDHGIAPGDSLLFNLVGRQIDMRSFYPENPYVVIGGGEPRDVKLHFARTANTPEAAATIHYTLDGTEPSSASPVWTGPGPCASTTVRAIAIYLGRSSTVAEL